MVIISSRLSLIFVLLGHTMLWLDKKYPLSLVGPPIFVGHGAPVKPTHFK